MAKEEQNFILVEPDELWFIEMLHSHEVVSTGLESAICRIRVPTLRRGAKMQKRH